MQYSRLLAAAFARTYFIYFVVFYGNFYFSEIAICTRADIARNSFIKGLFITAT